MFSGSTSTSTARRGSSSLAIGPHRVFSFHMRVKCGITQIGFRADGAVPVAPLHIILRSSLASLAPFLLVIAILLQLSALLLFTRFSAIFWSSRWRYPFSCPQCIIVVGLVWLCIMWLCLCLCLWYYLLHLLVGDHVLISGLLLVGRRDVTALGQTTCRILIGVVTNRGLLKLHRLGVLRHWTSLHLVTDKLVWIRILGTSEGHIGAGRLGLASLL